jgi:hypothetical protein
MILILPNDLKLPQLTRKPVSRTSMEHRGGADQASAPLELGTSGVFQGASKSG